LLGLNPVDSRGRQIPLTDLSESWLRLYEELGEKRGLAGRLRAARRKGRRPEGLRSAPGEPVDPLRTLSRGAPRPGNRLDENASEGKEKSQRSAGEKGTKSGVDEA
jgi:hypothetical protein